MLENLSRQVIVPQTQYLSSYGQPISKDISGTKKISQFFCPSMLFPNRVQILSMTLLYQNDDTEKRVKIAVTKNVEIVNGSNKRTKNVLVELDDSYTLTHPPNELITTIKFKTPLTLEALDKFYFVSQDVELKDARLTISFRNYALD